jgi:hypothetical protein
VSPVLPALRRALLGLDDETARRVRPALDWMQSRGDGEDVGTERVAAYLREELPRLTGGADGAHEAHEVAWALADLFDAAGLEAQARLCRAPATHERISVRRWAASFTGVPDAFWQPALDGLDRLPVVPQRVRLSLVSATGLLEAVGDGLPLTPEGTLRPETVLALDDRFRWTEEFPWMHAETEADIPPLRFLHRHLLAQRLLAHEGGRVRPSEEGRACRHDLSRLWRAVVAPSPRWHQPFELDTLGVMAASLLRAPAFTPGRVAEELSHVLASKWSSATDRSVFDRASLVVQEWYQLGVPLGWWDSGRGPADRRPNAFGRAAAGAVLRAAVQPAE